MRKEAFLMISAGMVLSLGIILYTFKYSEAPAQTAQQMGVTLETGFIQCGNTPLLISGARGTNLDLTIVNTSSTSAFIGLASVTAGGGMVLRQNDAIVIDKFKGPIHCITDSGNAGLRWMQEINVH